MEATFRLAQVRNGIGRWAEVTVEVTPASRSEVKPVLDQAFAWRCEVYGADAWFGGSYDADLAHEAGEGARYALEHLPANVPPAEVVVIKVRDAPADTGPGDVKYVAAHAVWRALGIEPPQIISMGGAGNWVFP
jgi:hypothetical protein